MLSLIEETGVMHRKLSAKYRKSNCHEVDMVELDIQPTKDGNFICMHDETLDRTSTGKGTIKNYRLKN